MTRAYTIYKAVEAEGFRLEIRESLRECSDGLGTYFRGMSARVCSGLIIAVLPHLDCWDNAFSISHEICEYSHGFRHSESLYIMQCNLLARWHRLRTTA